MGTIYKMSGKQTKNPPPPTQKQPSAEMHTVQLTSSQHSSDEHLIFGKSRNEKPQTQLKASQSNLACSWGPMKELTLGQNTFTLA